MSLKKVGLLFMALAICVGLTGCGAKESIAIEIEMENGGIISVELYPDIAPKTVANFTKLIDEGFFDGLIFHRVYPGFMIQGGGFTAEGEYKSTENVKGEFSANGVKNKLSHTRGILSMARSDDPNSASSQFFITVGDATFLDDNYAAFGKVTDGMEYADEIANTPNEQTEREVAGKPLKDQIIKTIRRK